MIRIICKKDGFRRAGMVHSGIKTYPDGAFTAAQLAALRAEPNLVVEEGLPGKGDENGEADTARPAAKDKGK